METVPSPVCERVRAFVSLELDDELSELEGALLDGHLDRCAACARFRSEATAATGALRTAALEKLSAPVRLPVPPRLRHVRPTAFAAAAAVVVAAIVAAGPPGVGPAGDEDEGGPVYVGTTHPIDWDGAFNLRGTSARPAEQERPGGGGAGRLL
jgi:predicted anti-sigma-YlaC factor YlaD